MKQENSASYSDAADVLNDIILGSTMGSEFTNNTIPARQFFRYLDRYRGDTSVQGDGFNFDLFGKFMPSFVGLDDAAQSSLSNDLQLKKSEFDAQIALMNWQTWYNSEGQKIQRMRSAGLNPDLIGLDSASTASGSIDSNLGGETSSALQGSASIRQAVASERQANIQSALAVPQLILQGVSVVTGVFGAMAQIGVSAATKFLVNKQSEGVILDNFTKARGIAANKVIDGLSSLLGTDGDLSELSDDKIVEAIHEASSSITGDDPIDRIIRKEMSSIEKNPSVARQYWEDYSLSLKSRQDAAETRAHPLYNEDFLSMSDSFKPLMKASYDVLMSDLNKQIAETSYLLDYYNSADGTARALSENAVNDYNADYYNNLDAIQSSDTLNLSNKESYDALVYRQQFLMGIRDSMKGIFDRMQSDNKWTRFAAQAEYNILCGMYGALGFVRNGGTAVAPVD